MSRSLWISYFLLFRQPISQPIWRRKCLLTLDIPKSKMLQCLNGSSEYIFSFELVSIFIHSVFLEIISMSRCPSLIAFLLLSKKSSIFSYLFPSSCAWKFFSLLKPFPSINCIFEWHSFALAGFLNFPALFSKFVAVELSLHASYMIWYCLLRDHNNMEL